MFDERHLQLTSAYAKASQHFIRAFIYPLGEFIYKSIESAIDLKCRIEIGEETYFLTPDKDGGWKWSKGNFEGVTDEEIEQVEEMMAYLLPKLLSGSNDITPSNFPPVPDLPPVLPNPNSPLILPPSATSVEFLTIPFDSQNPQEYLLIQDSENLDLNASTQKNVFLTGEDELKDTLSQSYQESVDNSSEFVDEDLINQTSTNNEVDNQSHQNEVISSYDVADDNLTTKIVIDHTIPITSEKLELQNNQYIPHHPEHIDPQHWHELVVGSAIAPDIAHLNFSSLHFSYVGGEHEAWERLMISDKLSRTNTGSLSTRLLELYSHLDAGGWWCNSGVDPRTFANLTPGEQPQVKEWGCYKPNRPRPKTVKKDGFTVAVEGKFIKYEHPPSVDLSIFLLDVPGVIAQNIYSKAGVNPTDSDRLSGFWYCVCKHNIPLVITEGAKKAASLLSHGHAAIGLPGISSGYRSPKNEWGKKIGDSYLADELAVFATSSREIKICFDYETKPETKLNIQRDIWKTGSLLQEFGAVVKVVTLPGPDKGVDDFIVTQGGESFEKLSAGAIALEEWHQNQLDSLRFTIKLKDGTVKTIDQQKGDSTVTDAPELEPNMNVFHKNRRQPFIDPGSQIIDIKVIDSDIIHIDVTPESTQPTEPPVIPQNTKSISSWAKKENVTLYEPNFFRKRLEASENKQIAFAAYTLLKKYGVEAKDEQQQTSGKIYHADAFVIKNHGADKYSIYRRHDDVELMTFQADKWGHVGKIKLFYTEIESEPKIWREKQINILPIERQEFLLVADYLKAGKELPSVDEDPRKIASVVGSVSPKGTHNILESFKENEVLKILTQSITSFEKDDLTLGNYRILFRQTSDNISTLQLLKTEHNGTNREAVRFQFEKTDTGMTHQVQAMAITEADLEKLRLLAQKLHINYKALFGNPTDTRDIDLPVHPEITRNLDDDQSHQSTQSTPNVPDRKIQSNPQEASSNSPKQDNAVLPLHPVLKQYWEQLEKDGSSHETVAQGHLEFQSKIQETGKLTVGEQRELYQQIQNLAWSEINHNGRTDIVLPPLAHIVNDLREQVQKEAQPQFSFDPKRDTPMPLHPGIASHWHGLETNKTWSSVANQYNNPLREKLVLTGKLTIGEQRELYQKILLQSQFEQQNIGQTNISLPPLSDIIQDLLKTRSQVINNTYTPKVEVHSQKSHTQQRTTNSQELEL
jgi:polyhydroxyalkanoate synthesis regulator phasin